MYMSDLSSSLFGVSAGLTIVYYIVKSYVQDKPTTVKIVTYMYYILLAGGIVSLVYSGTNTMCGEIQWAYGFVYGIMPWLLIYGIFSFLLYLCPGWKAPFSNTFGYLYAKIKGAGDVLNNMINTSYKSKDIQNIYNDPSLLINTLTPLNFGAAVQKLIDNNILNPSRVNFKENMGKLANIVNGKDNIAECMWLLLVSGLISSMSASQVANIECEYSVEHLKKNEEKARKRLAEKEAAKKNEKPKQYVIRD